MSHAPLHAQDEAPSPPSCERAAGATEPGDELVELGLFIGSVRDYAIFMLDARGHVRTWNPGAERIKGYKREEIVGKHFSTFYPAEDIAAGKPGMELRVAAAEGRFEDEGWRVRKDGSYFWANVVITAVRDDAGKLVGFGKVTRDLTERREAQKRAEDERLRLAHAEEAVRLRDEFLAIAAHDLKSPLGAIGFQLEVLSRIEDLPERAVRQVERSLQASTRLVALVDTLLDVARITAGKLRLTRERFEVGAALHEVVYRLGEDARKTGSPITVREKHTIEGSWDRLRVEQVFTNLIGNAIQHGSTPIDVRVEREGNAAKITISDQGPGIAPEALERIFQRFERASTSPSSGGLGLGLYIVRQIVEAHGGTIEVASTPGAGATFTVRLPANDPA